MQEKSKGILIFAYNTNTVDYVSMAEKAASLAAKHLNLPVTLVTDQEIKSKHFQNVIICENNFKNKRVGYKQSETWRNGNRYNAYNLTPYDITLLIDSDYLVLDNSLLKIIETTVDYRLMHHNQNTSQSMDGNMGPLSLNFVWATVIVFNKTLLSKMLFDLVGRIQRNYSYYRLLYQIRETNFRNDYAFAIANNILAGYTATDSQSIPWTMLTFNQEIRDIEFKNNKLIVREEATAHIIPKQNIHIMDKEYLSSEKFERLVTTICQENL